MTIRSALDGPLPSFDGQTVIVGGGAVGITMAIALARAGHPVVVLEGGPREPRADYREANRGPLTGAPYAGLAEGRMKAFGGTTRLWGGQLVAFERRDFERTDESGEPLWPVSFEEIAPWIDAAFALLGVSPNGRDASAVWQRATGRPADLGDGLRMALNIWLPESDFTRLFAAEMANLPGLQVITDCPVTALRFTEGSQLVALEVAQPSGELRRIEPAQVILANGTIEIGGMLLRAATTEPTCPFADNHHIGRWYFDHLHGLLGELTPADRSTLSAMFDNVYFDGRKYSAKIRTGAVGRANAAGTLNPVLTFGQLAADARNLGRRMLSGGGSIGETVVRAATLGRIMLPIAWRYLRHRRSTSLFDRGVKFGLELEQMPTADCFLELDPTESPENARVGVHWAIDPRLADDIAEICERVERAFAAHELGKLALDPRVAARDPAVLDLFHDASHHMGGARMASSPENGVVDPELKVFGTANLYVAGAAVFPSGSFANPTLTAIAFGQRLATHLAGKRQPQPAGSRILERLAFGCSRLAGGASSRSSERLLEMALDAGVGAIDCAPSYGLGLAEKVVGKVLRRRPARKVYVIAKLGSERDSLGWAKSWLREAKGRLRGRQPRSHAEFEPIRPVDRYGRGDFSRAGLQASFAITRRRLGQIDALLLHDCGPAEFTVDVAQAAGALATEAGATLGYANSAKFDAATDAPFPPHCVAECAIDPRWLTREAAAPERDDLVLHSIVPTGDWLARTDPAFNAALNRAAALVPSDPATSRMAALYALTAVRVPRARLVFASTDPGRLRALLGAFKSIDQTGSAERIAAEFAQ